MPRGSPVDRDQGAHGFQTNLERRLDRETGELFRRRLEIAAWVGAVLFPLYTLLDLQVVRGEVPTSQLLGIVAVRLASGVSFGGLALLLRRRRPQGRLLAAIDLLIFTIAGLTCAYIIAVAWGIVLDYWVGLAQVVVARCMFLPGGPRRAAPACVAMVAALPIGLWLFHGADAAVFAGDSGGWLRTAMSGMVGFVAIGLVGSMVYDHAVTLGVKAQHQGRYVVESLIDRGGMGAVYRAWDTRLGRPCALKVVSSGRAGDTEAARARFELEAQRTGQLRGGHVVEIYDYGETIDGDLYYTMELLEGCSVQELVADVGPLPAARVIHLARQACSGLAEAHRLGLVHRDVKPANLFLAPRAHEPDWVVVLDFGLVKLAAAPEVRPVGDTPPPDDAEVGINRFTDSLTSGASHETGAGSMVGTPAYMAPEQVARNTADERSDVYAIGGVMYFMLTGRPPFDEALDGGLLRLKLQADPIRPSARMGTDPLPRDLEGVVMRCLTREPADRFASMASLRDALDRCEQADAWGAEQARAAWGAMPRAAAVTDVVEGRSDPPSTVRRVRLGSAQDAPTED